MLDFSLAKVAPAWLVGRSGVLNPQITRITPIRKQEKPSAKSAQSADTLRVQAGPLQSFEFSNRLSFVRLLARANEIVDGFGSFCALPLLKFTHPARDGIDHVAGRLTRGLWFDRLSLSTFGALYNFYYFFL